MIYFDHSATTRPLPAAREAMLAALEEFGNPSSLHSAGLRAERLVRASREALAQSLGVGAGEIFFTSGATESNNTALFGAARARKKRGRRIVASALEHPSVARCLDALEAEGFEVVRVFPREGSIREEDLFKVITADTVLVSLMAVQSETGERLPIEGVAARIRETGAPALFHVDAVQAYGRLPLFPKRQGIDLLSLSGHKIGGPKGVGALYVGKGVHLPPLLLGGGQEAGLRSGTENVPAIAGMGAAVRFLFSPEGKEALRELDRVGLSLEERLREAEGVVPNFPERKVSYISNVSLPPVLSETILHALDARGLIVSAGSACSSKAKQSAVLQAYGLTGDRLRSAIRISLGLGNTEAEVDALLAALQDCRKLAHR